MVACGSTGTGRTAAPSRGTCAYVADAMADFLADPERPTLYVRLSSLMYDGSMRVLMSIFKV
jgi:hypothetical protein